MLLGLSEAGARKVKGCLFIGCIALLQVGAAHPAKFLHHSGCALLLSCRHHASGHLHTRAPPHSPFDLSLPNPRLRRMPFHLPSFWSAAHTHRQLESDALRVEERLLGKG